MPDDGKEADLLRVLEALDAARELIIVASMLVVDIGDVKAEPVRRALVAAEEKLNFAREKLDIYSKAQTPLTGITRLSDWRPK